MRWALLLVAACGSAAPAPVPRPASFAPVVEATAAASDLRYTLALGTPATLELHATVTNRSDQAWDNVRLAVEVEVEADRTPPEDIDVSAAAPPPAPAPTALETIDRVFFVRNRAQIEPHFDSIISVWTDVLDGEPSLRRVEVRGHTSPDERDGEGLSLARARAVEKALIARGIDPSRLVARGHADRIPLNPSKPHQSRRVELVILDRAAPDVVVGGAPPSIPPLPAQSLSRPAARAGSRRFTTSHTVSAAPGEKRVVTLLRMPAQGRDVLLTFAGDSEVWRGLVVTNTSEHTLPFGRLDTPGIDGALERLEPRERTLLTFARVGVSPVTVVDSVAAMPPRVLSLTRGFAITETLSRHTVRFTNVSREDVYVAYRKSSNVAPSAPLPASTIDVGELWWLLVPRGTYDLQLRELQRGVVNLVEAPLADVMRILEDSAVPRALAESIISARKRVDDAKRGSPAYYRARHALRTLLETATYAATP